MVFHISIVIVITLSINQSILSSNKNSISLLKYLLCVPRVWYFTMESQPVAYQFIEGMLPISFFLNPFVLTVSNHTQRAYIFFLCYFSHFFLKIIRGTVVLKMSSMTSCNILAVGTNVHKGHNVEQNPKRQRQTCTQQNIPRW